MSEHIQQPEDGKFDPSAFDSLGKEDRWAAVSRHLVTLGILSLVLAAFCVYSDRTGHRDFFVHRDFALNPNALGRWFMSVGMVFYIAGRGIKYYRRFRKKNSR